MRKQSKIDGFLKRKNASSSQNPEQPPEIVLDESPHTSNIPVMANEHFPASDVCQLVEKYYPEDFSEQEKHVLKLQLKHYEIDVISHPDYKSLNSISDLCQWLVKTRRITNFDLIYRVVSLILTLPVSTATTERSFSAMSLIKTRLRNKMEDEFLNDSLVLYFERELSKKISLATILEDFRKAKDRRIPL